MPTNRRYRRRVRIDDVPRLTMAIRKELLFGAPLYRDQPTDREVLEAAWDAYQDELLPEYIRQCPGRRPFAWWCFTHQQERPIIAEVRDPQERACIVGCHTFQNFLHSDLWGAWPAWPSWTPFQEPERDYLNRHGLLSEEERQALAAADAEE